MADVNQVVEQAGNVWAIKDYMYLAAVLISCFMFFLAYRRDKNSQGDSELKLFEIITKAEKDWVDLNAKINLAPNDEALTLGDARIPYAQYVLNSYDMGCQRYLDRKLDKKRFSKTYKVRIHQLYSDADFKPFLGGGDFKYAALDKVHRKLNNLEGN